VLVGSVAEGYSETDGGVVVCGRLVLVVARDKVFVLPPVGLGVTSVGVAVVPAGVIGAGSCGVVVLLCGVLGCGEIAPRTPPRMPSIAALLLIGTARCDTGEIVSKKIKLNGNNKINIKPVSAIVEIRSC
jgi:hypothetical protein